MGNTERLGLARESRILLLICAVDLVVTLWLVNAGHATEGNPLMAFYLGRGSIVLIAVKATLTLFPIFILEWCRRRQPRFVHGMLRVAIAAYLGIYLVAFMNVNVLALYKDPQRLSRAEVFESHVQERNRQDSCLEMTTPLPVVIYSEERYQR